MRAAPQKQVLVPIQRKRTDQQTAKGGGGASLCRIFFGRHDKVNGHVRRSRSLSARRASTGRRHRKQRRGKENNGYDKIITATGPTIKRKESKKEKNQPHLPVEGGRGDGGRVETCITGGVEKRTSSFKF